MNMNAFKLSSSILSADFGYLEDQIRLVEASGVEWIHIDVMDGCFVPNITMGQFIVETCRKITDLPLDVHLMIVNPERHIDTFIKAGASNLTLHIENNPNIYRTLQEVRKLGCSPGIAINPGTSVNQITPVLEIINMVLVMTVNPGYSGQVFIPGTVRKIAETRSLIQSINQSVEIEVDGGITAETLPICYKEGARIFVAATSIFKNASGISAGVKSLRESI